MGGRLVPTSVQGVCRAKRTGREETEASDLPGNEEGRRIPVAFVMQYRVSQRAGKIRCCCARQWDRHTEVAL